MDVIINNPASQPQFAQPQFAQPPYAQPQYAQPQVQYVPITQTPSGYGPGYGEYQGHHGGPGFVLPLLLIGGFLFFRGRNKRRRMMQRWQMAGGPATPQDSHAAPDFVDDIRENFRRGRQRFMNDGALGIARERYARGEINADEYQAIVKALTGEQAAGRVNIGKDTSPDII